MDWQNGNHAFLLLLLVILCYARPRILEGSRASKHASSISETHTKRDQLPDSCIYFANEGDWNQNFTHWNSRKEENTSILRQFLQPSSIPRSMHPPSVKHVLFCGDSTMARQFAAAINSKRSASMYPTWLKRAGRCDLMEYYNLSKAEDWAVPDAPSEGPGFFGLANPFCTDCKGCNAQLVAFFNKTVLRATYEYIPVEFAKDKEFQTDTTGTSQETLATYLSKTFKRDLCILNAGIHDQGLNNFTTAQYTINVLEYIGIIQRFCKKVVWIQTNAVLEDGRYGQNNLDLLRCNESIRRSCSQLGNHVLLFDVWNMSMPRGLHRDNVHLQPAYYSRVAQLLLH